MKLIIVATHKYSTVSVDNFVHSINRVGEPHHTFINFAVAKVVAIETLSQTLKRYAKIFDKSNRR